ncbi:MAG: hypothetical protein PHW22_01040 [Bacilli bacterium]|nr:hypothetical protein [Bacilli bacterium]
MITISLLGVDQFQAQSFVADVQDEVAQAFEVAPEEIVFYAPDSFLIYRGVDQTSYQLNIVVSAPRKYEPIEKQAADVLIKIFKQNHVHVRVLFEYFAPQKEYEYINKEYPRFMTNDNMAHFETMEEADEKEGIEPYLGDAFADADYENKIKAKDKELALEEIERLKKNKED